MLQVLMKRPKQVDGFCMPWHCFSILRTFQIRFSDLAVLVFNKVLHDFFSDFYAEVSIETLRDQNERKEGQEELKLQEEHKNAPLSERSFFLMVVTKQP